MRSHWAVVVTLLFVGLYMEVYCLMYVLFFPGHGFTSNVNYCMWNVGRLLDMSEGLTLDFPGYRSYCTHSKAN